MDADTIYLKWKDASEPEKTTLLNLLIENLTTYAKAICWTKIPNQVQEHDVIVNGALANAVLALPSFEGGSKLGTWFNTVVLHEIADYFRSLDANTVRLAGFQETLVDDKDLDERIFEKELLESVEGLSTEEQRYLDLRLEGRTHDEIAEVLKITPEASKMRWDRLRDKLQEQLYDKYFSDRV